MVISWRPLKTRCCIFPASLSPAPRGQDLLAQRTIPTENIYLLPGTSVTPIPTRRCIACEKVQSAHIYIEISISKGTALQCPPTICTTPHSTIKSGGDPSSSPLVASIRARPTKLLLKAAHTENAKQNDFCLARSARSRQRGRWKSPQPSPVCAPPLTPPPESPLPAGWVVRSRWIGKTSYGS